MAFISKTFKNPYKLINNNLISSSNTKYRNVDNSLRIDRRTRDNRQTGQNDNQNQRAVVVTGNRDTIENQSDWLNLNSHNELKIAIEQLFFPMVDYSSKTMVNFESTPKEEMVEGLRYFNSLEKEVESLKSQLKSQNFKISKTTDRLLEEIISKDFRTKKPLAVPISAGEPIRTMNRSVATPHKRTANENHPIHLRLWVLKEHDDLHENDLLTGNHGSDHYTIKLQESSSPTPSCFIAKASSSQAWLWRRLLSYLNFDTINLLSKKNIVNGLPQLNFVKDHLCSSRELGKTKRGNFKSKTTPSSKGRLHLLHMDLCAPTRVESINGKKYILMIVDDYSRYTWTHFLRSTDETPKVLINFLKMIQRGLQAQVKTVRTDKWTKFLNKTLQI
ncbi:retrovirus-related pol polyprotein from transposon TNT 1-94 [Tanacetum coccineum]